MIISKNDLLENINTVQEGHCFPAVSLWPQIDKFWFVCLKFVGIQFNVNSDF